MNRIIDHLAEFVQAIRDKVMLAVPPDTSGVAMAATFALIARGVRDLHLVAVPQSGL